MLPELASLTKKALQRHVTFKQFARPNVDGVNDNITPGCSSHIA